MARSDGAGNPVVRDRALNRLSRANRWLVGATVLLSGAFSAAAALAKPGSAAHTKSATANIQVAATPTANGSSAVPGGDTGASSATPTSTSSSPSDPGLAAPSAPPQSARAPGPVTSGGS